MRWCLLLLAVLSLPLWAIDTEPALPTAALQQRYYDLTHEFRCLVCQDQTIADSDAGLAADLRAQVYQQLKRGRSDQQIRQYMVARYGDFVLFNPPFQPNTWLLWLGPGALVLAGLTTAAVIVRRRQRVVTGADPEDDDELEW